MQQPDADLVGRSRCGDLVAYNQIVERYQSHVFNLAARILGNSSDAEDVSQETFISAHRALRGFRGGSLRSWLLRIATNLCYDRIRASRRRKEQSLDQSMLDPGFAGPISPDSPEQEAMRTELRGEIQRGILSLPVDQRAVLVMIDVPGLSYEETAQATGTSLGTVKSRLSRARGRVRNHMLQHRELLPGQLRQRE